MKSLWEQEKIGSGRFYSSPDVAWSGLLEAWMAGWQAFLKKKKKINRHSSVGSTLKKHQRVNGLYGNVVRLKKKTNKQDELLDMRSSHIAHRCSWLGPLSGDMEINRH